MRLGTRDYTLGTTWSKSGSTVQTGKPRHPHIIGCRTLKNPDSHVRNLKHKSNPNAASGEVMGFTRYIKGEALTRQMPPRCLPVTLGTNARSRRQQTLRYVGDGLSPAGDSRLQGRSGQNLQTETQVAAVKCTLVSFRSSIRKRITRHLRRMLLIGVPM